MPAMGRSALLCLGLAALVLGAFQPAFDAGFLNWDDNLILTENPRYRGLSGEHLRWMLTAFHGGHWEPLVWFSFALDHARVGMDPGGYHVTNILLHGVNAVLVYAVARALLPDTLDKRRIGAWASAALFAVHPLRVESVAWVVERRDVLSATLFLATALLWLRRARGDGLVPLFFSYATFGLALTAKAAGLAWPLVFLLLDAWPMARHRTAGWRPLIVEKLPYFALAIAAIFPMLAALEGFGATDMGGALSPAQRGAQALFGVAFYVEKTLIPIGLSPLYLLDLDLAPLSPPFLLRGLAVVALTVVLVRSRRRAPAGLLVWVSYLLLIGPFLGLLSNGIHLAADRYSYVACLPFALLAGAGIARLDTRAPAWGLGISIALPLILAGLSWRQARVWQDSTSLWDRAIEVQHENYIALTKRGLARLEAGERDGARADFTAAIEARPRYAPAYANRGVLTRASDPLAAMADFNQALDLRPNDFQARVNRGALRLSVGDAEGALLDLSAALRLQPGSLEARLNRGLAHLANEDSAAALADLQQVLERAPANWAHRPLAERKAAEARAGQ